MIYSRKLWKEQRYQERPTPNSRRTSKNISIPMSFQTIKKLNKRISRCIWINWIRELISSWKQWRKQDNKLTMLFRKMPESYRLMISMLVNRTRDLQKELKIQRSIKEVLLNTLRSKFKRLLLIEAGKYILESI